MKLPSLTADSASEFRRIPNKFNRLPNKFVRSSNLIPTVPVGGDIKGTVLVRISTTAAPTLTKEASASASVSVSAQAKGHYTYFAIADVTISATAAGQRTAGGTANIGVDITSTADGSVFTAHSGVATVGVTIEATAAAATGTTHSSSTADCQVNITASANGYNISDTIPDETANGNNMVMEGTGWTFETDAAVGTRSVDFGNSGTSYGIIDESYLSVFRSPWSFSCWYKPDNGTIGTTGGGTSILYLLHTGINGPTNPLGSHYQMYHYNRKLRWWSRIDTSGASTLRDTGNVFSEGSGTNDWVHIVVTVDNVGNPTMYIDGSETTLTTDSTPNTENLSEYSNTSDVRIGYGRTGTAEGYKIDDVSIWSTELTSTQVSNLYNSGSGTDLTGSSNLAGWWKMGDSNVVPVTHTGAATVSVDVTASASGETFTTHSGTASCQVNLSASASGTVTSPDYEQEVSEITSLKGWFDANKPNGTDQTGFTNGTAVTTWTSRVGTSVTLGQSTASAKPTWNTSQINSLPAIDFAVGDWLNSTSTDIKDIVHGQNNIAITTYVVMQVDNYPSSSASGDAMVLGWEDTVTSVGSQDVFHLPRIERGTGYLQLLERAGGTGLTNLAGYEYQTALGTGSYKYFGCIAGATSITLRVNGSEQTLSNYLGGTWNTAQTHDAHQLQVGGFSNAGGSQILLDGKIAEILIFNSTLGSTDIASVENYITDKYNL